MSDLEKALLVLAGTVIFICILGVWLAYQLMRGEE